MCAYGWSICVALTEGLPQGAPTSPYLSNLVNSTLDARLCGLAKKYQFHYTRYADDITLSAVGYSRGNYGSILHWMKQILSNYGYKLNLSKSRVITSQHQQLVTGLVVNKHVSLPRVTRRRLRAMNHYIQTGRIPMAPCGADTHVEINDRQVDGWNSYAYMVNGAKL